MRVSIIVGPDGVERVVSVGQGLKPTEEAFRFLSHIWGEVQSFHSAVLRKAHSVCSESESDGHAAGSSGD